MSRSNQPPDDRPPASMRGRPPALSPDEQHAGDLLIAAMGRVNDLVDEIVERDPSGRWFSTLMDRRLRTGDDMYLVEDLLRDLMPAVQRVGDLMDLTAELHFGRVKRPIPWAWFEHDPHPLRSAFKTWPAITDRYRERNDDDPDFIVVQGGEA